MNLKIILDNLNFQNIISSSDNELKKIREIRNEDNIRKNMRSKKIILIEEHLRWFNKIKLSKTNFFYVIRYKKNIVGGLGLNHYDKNTLFGEWSYYISGKTKFIGLGASIEYKAIEYFFNSYKLNRLFCYVLSHNSSVSKIHNKFGFEEISFDEYIKHNNLEDKDPGGIYLSLKKSNWSYMNKKIYKKYFL
jgi:UDP-4-amino-4,6-dideoxy-N-acetyl-beta-L-altrosamine N-acetyltransferase